MHMLQQTEQCAYKSSHLEVYDPVHICDFQDWNTCGGGVWWREWRLIFLTQCTLHSVDGLPGLSLTCRHSGKDITSHMGGSGDIFNIRGKWPILGNGSSLGTDGCSWLCGWHGQLRKGPWENLHCCSGTFLHEYSKTIELSFSSKGLLVGSWSYDFSLVVLHIISITAFTCGPCSEVVFEFEKEQPISVYWGPNSF